jgi:beta-glucosidase-like glycosyl hydrolase
MEVTNVHSMLIMKPAVDFSINGVPSCANKVLLTDILRNEWNFKGI